jgi:hypothetical protein
VCFLAAERAGRGAEAVLATRGSGFKKRQKTGGIAPARLGAGGDAGVLHGLPREQVVVEDVFEVFLTAADALRLAGFLRVVGEFFE